MNRQAATILVFGLLAQGICAAEQSFNPILDEDITLQGGSYWIDAEGSFRSTNIGNQTVNLTLDDLGIDTKETSPWLSGRWRFTDRWRITMDYFSFDNSGGNTAAFDFNFGDLDVPVDARVNAALAIDLYTLNLGYSLLHSERARLGLGVGIHAADLKATVGADIGAGNTATSLGNETADILAPLPNINLYGAYAFTPDLAMEFAAGWFGLDYDQYSGDLVTLDTSLEYRITKNFGAGIGYRYIDADLTIDKNRRTDRYNVDMNGPILFLSAGF